MVEQPDAPPPTGGGHSELIGNHPALDLVNTVGWRLDPQRTVDRLPDGAALVRWAAYAGLVDRATGVGNSERADLAAARIRDLRELRTPDDDEGPDDGRNRHEMKGRK